MRRRRQHGTTLSLLLSAQPRTAALMTVGLTAAAALSGRPAREVGLVALTVLVGQLTIGWINDVADRDRDAAAGREDKPVALGWIDPGTVTFAAACATLLLVPLSVSNGTAAGVAYLLAVLTAWVYNVWFRRSALSWLPWAVGFALLPAFLSYGGWGGGVHGGPPTVAVTLLAAALGVGVHVLTALPDLVGDHQVGSRHLPLRIALRIGAPRLLWIATTYTALVVAGLLVATLTVGLVQA